MSEKFNESTPQRPEGDRVLDAQLVQIDLAKYIREIKNEEAWHKSDRNAITIFKADAMTIVLVALHANAEMKPHTAKGVISVQVLEGSIKFGTTGQSVTLDKTQMVTLHENIQHSVVALEESVFLLTVAHVK